MRIRENIGLLLFGLALLITILWSLSKLGASPDAQLVTALAIILVVVGVFWKAAARPSPSIERSTSIEHGTGVATGNPPVSSSASEGGGETGEGWELPDLQTMRKHYDGYSPITAEEVLEAIPKAYVLWCKEGGRWGPGIVARFCNVTSTTVGRYLKAFKEAGLTEVDGIEIP